MNKRQRKKRLKKVLTSNGIRDLNSVGVRNLGSDDLKLFCDRLIQNYKTIEINTKHLGAMIPIEGAE